MRWQQDNIILGDEIHGWRPQLTTHDYPLTKKLLIYYSQINLLNVSMVSMYAYKCYDCILHNINNIYLQKLGVNTNISWVCTKKLTNIQHRVNT